jgi:hypothetical protein
MPANLVDESIQQAIDAPPSYLLREVVLGRWEERTNK